MLKQKIVKKEDIQKKKRKSKYATYIETVGKLKKDEVVEVTGEYVELHKLYLSLHNSHKNIKVTKRGNALYLMKK